MGARKQNPRTWTEQHLFPAHMASMARWHEETEALDTARTAASAAAVRGSNLGVSNHRRAVLRLWLGKLSTGLSTGNDLTDPAADGEI